MQFGWWVGEAPHPTPPHPTPPPPLLAQVALLAHDSGEDSEGDGGEGSEDDESIESGGWGVRESCVY